MKTIFAVTALILCSLAFGESCPVGQVYDDCNRTMTGMCTPGCRASAPQPGVTGPTGPDALCVSAYCHPVAYAWAGDFALAQSALGNNGYPVLGSAGPCFTEDRSQCPDIFNQAFNDLRLKALQANRAQSWLSRE